MVETIRLTRSIEWSELCVGGRSISLLGWFRVSLLHCTGHSVDWCLPRQVRGTLDVPLTGLLSFTGVSTSGERESRDVFRTESPLRVDRTLQHRPRYYSGPTIVPRQESPSLL